MEENRRQRLDSEAFSLGQDPHRLCGRPTPGVIMQAFPGDDDRCQGRAGADPVAHIVTQGIAGIPIGKVAHDIGTAQNTEHRLVAGIEFEGANVESGVWIGVPGQAEFGKHFVV